MRKKNAIQIKNLSKKFLLSFEKPTLLETTLFREKREFWALKNINLKIKRGGQLGIIGPNGAGKSTLLRIISGITAPTQGKVEVGGRIASLIDLRAGFHPDLSGRENLFINGLLLGMTRAEIEEKFDQIVDFSGLKPFIDVPLRAYSNGMVLRLGFSVIAHFNPDIFLIDEVIEVGDEEFKKKCRQTIKNFYSQGKTILLVSHNLGLLKNLSQTTLWLEKGRVKSIGATQAIIKKYQAASQ